MKKTLFLTLLVAFLVTACGSDTTEEGVGCKVTVPIGVTSVTVKLQSRAETGPAGARTVGVRLYNRGIPV